MARNRIIRSGRNVNLYRLLSLRNDLKSLLKGRPAQRIMRKQIYKGAFKAASFVTRLLGVGR